MVCVRKMWVSRTRPGDNCSLLSTVSITSIDAGDEAIREDATAEPDDIAAVGVNSSSSDGLKEKAAAIFREREFAHGRDWVPLFCDILQYEKRVADYLKQQEQQIADLHAIKSNSKRVILCNMY